MTLQAYDEPKLKLDLENLSDIFRLAFATAAAGRQLRLIEWHCAQFDTKIGPDPRSIIADLRAHILGDRSATRDWALTLQALMEALPTDDELLTVSHVLLDHALSTLAYAIRTLQTGLPQEAVWAARRAYESADQAVMALLDMVPSGPDEEVFLLSHPIIQRELLRQGRDIHALLTVQSDSGARSVLDYSEAESLLTAEEFEALKKR